jgi:hypothetical protein
MFTQEDWDRGVVEVAPSRFVATRELWQLMKGESFDPESFVPTDPKQHELAHAIKGDTEFATDDKHGPLYGPIVDYLTKHHGVKVRTPQLGDVWMALRAVIPNRNLTVWLYPPEAEGCVRQFHAAP